MDKKTREMARGIIRDMVWEEAGLLRLEIQQLDHVMDHLERDLEDRMQGARRAPLHGGESDGRD